MADPRPGSLPAPRRLRWAVAGLVTGFVVGTVVGGIVLGVGDYDPSVPAGVGHDLGRSAMQLVNDVELDDHRLPIVLLFLLQVPLWVGLLGAPLMARREGMSWRRDLRWAMRPVDVPIGLVTGVVLQLVLVPLLYVPIFWIFGEQDVEEAARSLVGRADGPLDIVVLMVVTVLGAPVVEEVFFRGLLHGALVDRLGRSAATAVSATVFAATHLQLLQFPALLLVGAVHALLMDRTGRLAAAVWSHVGFNMVTVYVLLAG